MNFLKKYFLIILFIPILSLAHQPRIVSVSDISFIKNSDTSQAFYGELFGEYKIFNLEVDYDQPFYFGLLVPDLSQIEKNFSAELYWEKDGASEVLSKLDGSNFEWKQFYEEFARDSYWKGPEATINLEKGSYFIKISNPNNIGKYVLVVGEKESFPLSEIAKTLYTLPLIKKNFWGKNFLDGYLNIFGLSVLLVFFIVVLLIKTFFKKVNKK